MAGSVRWLRVTKREDGWHGFVLGLPEVIVRGATRHEALRLTVECARDACSERFERGDAVPEHLRFLLVDRRVAYVCGWEDGQRRCRKIGPPPPH